MSEVQKAIELAIQNAQNSWNFKSLVEKKYQTALEEIQHSQRENGFLSSEEYFALRAKYCTLDEDGDIIDGEEEFDEAYEEIADAHAESEAREEISHIKIERIEDIDEFATPEMAINFIKDVLKELKIEFYQDYCRTSSRYLEVLFDDDKENCLKIRFSDHHHAHKEGDWDLQWLTAEADNGLCTDMKNIIKTILEMA